MPKPAFAAKLFADARIWQILSLGLLLAFGLSALGFDQAPANVALIVATALATQWVGQRLVQGKAFDPLSPLITALSLCLLLRAESPAVAGARSRARHRLEIRAAHRRQAHLQPRQFRHRAAARLCSECAWISPAQWGATTWSVFLFV